MARTQKNKATNYHLGTLKAKLAKLRNELLIEQGGGGGGGPSEGFDVARLGDARVALIGFPSGEFYRDGKRELKRCSKLSLLCSFM